MDFLENLKSVAIDAAQTVAKKSGELATATKVQYMVLELKSDIKKLYSSIGKLVYLAIEGEEDHTEEIQTKCAIISEKLAKIDKLKNGEADTCECQTCGTKMDADDEYCASCGDAVEEAVDDVVDFAEEALDGEKDAE